MAITLDSRKVIYFLIMTFVFLLLGNFFNIYIKYFTDLERFETVRKITHLLNFDLEQNLPTLFSSCILFFSAILLHYISKIANEGRNSTNWLILAFIFYFLSVDEAVSIHELFIHPVRRLLGTSGFLYWAWVIPYGIAIIAFLVYNIKFFLTLPVLTLKNFFIAGFLFVMGAMGFEMLGAYLFTENNGLTFNYAIIATMEESLEMVGIIYFIYAIFQYIEINHDGVFARFYIANKNVNEFEPAE